MDTEPRRNWLGIAILGTGMITITLAAVIFTTPADFLPPLAPAGEGSPQVEAGAIPPLTIMPSKASFVKSRPPNSYTTPSPIPQGLGNPLPSPAPLGDKNLGEAGPTATPVRGEDKPFVKVDTKWIEVYLSQQKLIAYENGKPVFEALVSTGISRYPTVTGRYRIYLKLISDTMTGPGYYLPNVPYVMYFYRGYALHGTYWHSNFGHPMSHGCINLRTEDAKWLFEWTSPKLPPGAGYVYASKNNPGTLIIIRP